MKASELREKSVSDLENELLELRKEQFNLRMQQATGQMAQTDQIGKARKNIARVKTVLNEKVKAGEAS